MKVLFVNVNMHPGGAERQLCNIASELVANDICVEFLVFKKVGRYLNVIEELGVKISEFPSYKNNTRGLVVIKRVLFLKEFIRINKFTTVVSFLPACNIICELSKFLFRGNWKLIAGARSCDSSFVKNFSYKIHYLCYSLCDVIISNSENTKKDILNVNKWIKPEKIMVIYNYVSINYDCLQMKSRSLLDNNGVVNIVVPANYGEEKNILSVIEALTMLSFKELGGIHIDWHGVIQHQNVNNFFDIANKKINEYRLSEYISLHDTTAEIYSIITKADVLGLFSISEGFPNSICEGMYLGKAIISTKVSDLPLLFKDTNNVLCDSSTPFGISQGLRILLAKSKHELLECGLENKKLAKKLFGIDNIYTILKILK